MDQSKEINFFGMIHFGRLCRCMCCYILTKFARPESEKEKVEEEAQNRKPAKHGPVAVSLRVGGSQPDLFVGIS